MRLLRLLFAAAILWVSGAHAAPLRIGLAADVTSMDPHFLNLQPNVNVSWHVFDALTHVNEDARLIPGLAESWRAVDPLTWEFRLRRGVKFHDGTDLTAEDVVFSIERTLAVPNGQFGTFTRRIVGKEIPDPYTLRLKTAAPYAMVPYDLNSVFIVSRKAATGARPEDFDSGKAMVGTGPFRFARFARGDRVELVLRRGRIQHVRLEHRVVSDAAERDSVIREHVRGELQVVTDLRPGALEPASQARECGVAAELIGRSGIAMTQR